MFRCVWFHTPSGTRSSLTHASLYVIGGLWCTSLAIELKFHHRPELHFLIKKIQFADALISDRLKISRH
jgi:hypothetical protein